MTSLIEDLSHEAASGIQASQDLVANIFRSGLPHSSQQSDFPTPPLTPRFGGTKRKSGALIRRSRDSISSTAGAEAMSVRAALTLGGSDSEASIESATRKT